MNEEEHLRASTVPQQLLLCMHYLSSYLIMFCAYGLEILFKRKKSAGLFG